MFMSENQRLEVLQATGFPIEIFGNDEHQQLTRSNIRNHI